MSKVHVILEAAREAVKDANAAIVLEPMRANGALSADDRFETDADVVMRQLISTHAYKKLKSSTSDYTAYMSYLDNL